MDMNLNLTEQLFIFLDIIITCVLTLAIGAEREAADKPAGVRTNMIVGGASCLFVSVMPYLINFIQDANFYDKVNPDPIRVLQAIVVGIGFIGAGTIMKPDGETRVKGITTAATLLFSAGIGITVGCGLYILAIGISLLLLLINRIVDKMVRKFTDIKDDKTDNE